MEIPQQTQDSNSSILVAMTSDFTGEWQVDFVLSLQKQREISYQYYSQSWEFKEEGQWIRRKGGFIQEWGSWKYDEKGIITIDSESKPAINFDILHHQPHRLWLQNDQMELHLVKRG